MGPSINCSRHTSTLLSFLLLGLLVATTFVLVCPAAQAAGAQYDALWLQDSATDFHGWTMNGATVSGTRAGPSVVLAPHQQRAPHCSSRDIDGGWVQYVGTLGLCRGHDPLRPGAYQGGINYYNGGSFYYGTLISPVHVTAQPIDHLIASWDAATPAGTWLEVHVRVREQQGWTHWYALPIWASSFSTIYRHSVDREHDGSGGVDTDTFYTAPGRFASAYQLGVTLFSTSPGISPSLRLVAAIASRDVGQRVSVALIGPPQSTDLPVPQRSQMLLQYRGQRFGGGGEAWCSPTSTSMVLAYWGQVLRRRNLAVSVPAAAAGTYDATYDGTGNWPFNTAFAAAFGLTAFVTRFASMSALQPWIRARVPVVISIAFDAGGLPGAPIPSSDGHLLVVRGFTTTGGVITNDPAAASDAAVRIVYRRADLERVWQAGSHGTAYLIYPPGWPVPDGG